MDNSLNQIEEAILIEIFNYNYKKFPSLKEHLPFVMVKSREYTGVGMYIHFEYLIKEIDFVKISNTHAFLSSNKRLVIDSLKNELNYELNITKGKLDFLELVTNDEPWDGNCKFFNLLD